MTSRTVDLATLSDANLGLADQAEMLPDDEVSPEASVLATRKRSLADRFLFNDRREPTAISKFVLLRRDLRNRVVFRRIIRRKNGTIRLDGQLYEVPLNLRALKIQLRLDPFTRVRVEVWYQNKFMGLARKANLGLNSETGGEQAYDR